MKIIAKEINGPAFTLRPNQVSLIGLRLNGHDDARFTFVVGEGGYIWVDIRIKSSAPICSFVFKRPQEDRPPIPELSFSFSDLCELANAHREELPGTLASHIYGPNVQLRLTRKKKADMPGLEWAFAILGELRIGNDFVLRKTFSEVEYMQGRNAEIPFDDAP